MSNDWLQELNETRAKSDPEYAAITRRTDMMHRLLVRRRDLGLTQEDMAERLGLSRVRVAQIESRPHRASLDMVARYAEAVGAHLDLVIPELKRAG